MTDMYEKKTHCLASTRGGRALTVLVLALAIVLGGCQHLQYLTGSYETDCDTRVCGNSPWLQGAMRIDEPGV